MCVNLSTRASRGTPYCNVSEIAVAKESIRPEIVEPSFDIVRKISPGWPSSKSPTVMYPSWPATENLCVIARRSSGSFRRTGCGGAAFPTYSRLERFVGVNESLFDAAVFRGCVRLQPRSEEH